MMLTVEGLSKRFGGFLAVNQVSFEVREGEILGLIGPNGSGKSTTFNLIAGNLRPTSGSVRLQGKEIAGLPAYAICHKGVGRTFQIPRPFRKLSLLENVMLAAYYGRRREYRARRSSAQSRRGARYGRAPIRCDSADRWAWRCRAQEARTCPCARHQAALAPGRREPGWSRLEQKWSALPNCSTISEPEWA